MGIPALTPFSASLDAVRNSVRGPAGRPVVLLGPGARWVAHGLLGQLLLSGEKAVVVDGSNRFDAYHLAGMARSARVLPGELLARARVSRAFSPGQLLSVLEEKALGEATRTGARWIFALGPLDLLADHDLKEPEARRSASRVVSALTGLVRAGLFVLASQEEGRLWSAKREFLLEPVNRECRVVSASVGTMVKHG